MVTTRAVNHATIGKPKLNSLKEIGLGTTDTEKSDLAMSKELDEASLIIFEKHSGSHYGLTHSLKITSTGTSNMFDHDAHNI